MTEQFLCPECAKPISDSGDDVVCGNCGWSGKGHEFFESLTEDDIEELIFEWFDANPGKQVKDIKSDYPGIDLAKVWEIKKRLQYKKEKVERVEPREMQELKSQNAKLQQLIDQQANQFQQLRQKTEFMVASNPQTSVSNSCPVCANWTQRYAELRDDFKESRKKIDDLEKELRGHYSTPRTPDAKWAKVEDALMERFVTETVKPATKGTWVDQIMEGVAPHVPNIIGGFGELMEDMKNKGNPEYNPYANLPPVPAQPQPRPVQRQPVQRVRSPAPPPSPVQRNPQPQPEPEPEPEAMEPDVPEFTEEIEQPIEIQQTPSGDDFQKQAQLDAIVSDITTRIQIPADIVVRAARATVEEIPQEPLEKKVAVTVEILRKVAMLRDIGIGLKQVLKPNGVTVVQAADFMIKQHPQYAKVLAETGFEMWLDKCKYFADHPEHGKDVQFLNRPDVKPIMGSIVEEIKKKLSM